MAIKDSMTGLTNDYFNFIHPEKKNIRSPSMDLIKYHSGKTIENRKIISTIKLLDP
jgi:hypothetical protein